MASSVNPRMRGQSWSRLGAAIVCAALALGGCANPKVKYQPAEVLGPSSLARPAGGNFLFRVPRSQILVSAGDHEKRINPAVLDPVPTGEWAALPFNPGYFYRIAILQDDAGTMPLAQFRAAFGRNVRVFPVPACMTARVEIGARGGDSGPRDDQLRLKLEAVATEYDYPSDDGTLSYSPLYEAKPKRGWFSATRLDVVKYPNTQIVKAIGVEVEDHFAEAITVLAGIAKTGAKMMGVPPEPEAEFAIIPLFSSSITVADNRRVGLAPLPKNGKISLHSVCGADITEEGSATALDFLKNAQTAMAQAKELYDVWNAGE